MLVCKEIKEKDFVVWWETIARMSEDLGFSFALVFAIP